MKILFTICGRAGSKGIKNKNIRDFLGRPLPYYTLSAIDLYKKMSMEDDIDIVANSDSQELLKLMSENPFFPVSMIERRAELAGDNIPKISVILDCLEFMQDKSGSSYDIVVDLDITSPLRTKMDIANLINKQKECNADVTFSVTNARRNPYFNMVMKTESGYAKVLQSDFTARQQAPDMFDMNASMYAYNPQYLYQKKGILDGYCECIHMYDTGILDLDHENDFELMEVIAAYLFETKDLFREVSENTVRRSRE